MTRDRLVSFFFITLLLIILYQVCLIFSSFFEPLFWACVLAFVFHPVFLRLKKIFGGHETPAALLTVLLIILTVVPLLMILAGHLFSEAVKFYDLSLDYVEGGRLKQWIDQMQLSPIAKKLESHKSIADFVHRNLQSWIIESA